MSEFNSEFTRARGNLSAPGRERRRVGDVTRIHPRRIPSVAVMPRGCVWLHTLHHCLETMRTECKTVHCRSQQNTKQEVGSFARIRRCSLELTLLDPNITLVDYFVNESSVHLAPPPRSGSRPSPTMNEIARSLSQLRHYSKRTNNCASTEL